MDQRYLKQYFQIAAKIQKKANILGLSRGELPLIELFDTLITDKFLRKTSRQLFADGHFAQAVEEAYKFVNNSVKSKTGLPNDGSSLMKSTFTPNNPILQLNSLKTVSQRDQQLGYMEILSGCMTGIRNPRAHEHQYLDAPEVALEMLTWANHLIRMIKQSKKVTKKNNT